ncbi:MAG: DUF4446 family protein [Patescibacteria group bacterium]
MFVQISFVIFFVWLAIVSFILYQTRKHYFDLTHRTGSGRIDEILNRILGQSNDAQQRIQNIESVVQKIEQEAKLHFQKIGIVHFNPFGRTNSTDQSFVLALLDHDRSGVVINFIYTREGVRVYTKIVKSGKGKEYQLTDEEKKAIESSTQL